MFTAYNTLTKQTETVAESKKPIGMYQCGPTVYNYAHIGNYRAALLGDLLKRTLLFLGYKVHHVMNITDIDDKIIRDHQQEGVSRKEFTDRYEKAFFDDLAQLKYLPATNYPRATEHINEMVAIIQKLLDKKYAYVGNDGSIYYSVHAFKEYGKLAHIDVTSLKSGASGRVKKDEYTKDEVSDFALWKSFEPTDGPNFWSPHFMIDGKKTAIKGRPGWHIECSGMSTKYLGNHFTFHLGGVDLIFPHHENEIAQTEPATGEKFVDIWMHNEHLLVDGKKMSKSLGNFYTFRDITAKGYSPLAFRYLMFATHYRQKLNFTFEALDAARNSIQRLQDFTDRMQEPFAEKIATPLSKQIADYEINFVEALRDDLNTPDALKAIFEMVNHVYSHIDKMSQEDARRALSVMTSFNHVFDVLSFDKGSLPKDIQELVDKREAARAKKDFKTADQLRDELKAKGYVLEDTTTGSRWKKANS